MKKKDINFNCTDNMHALLVAILSPKPLTVEQSFELYETGKCKNLLTDEDTIDMINIRNSNIKIDNNGNEVKGQETLSEIGNMYGLSASSICHRIAKYYKKYNIIADRNQIRKTC